MSSTQHNKKVCRFFNTVSGCKNGSKCTFLHSDGKSVVKTNGKYEATLCEYGDDCTIKGCNREHPSNKEELRSMLAWARKEIFFLKYDLMEMREFFEKLKNSVEEEKMRQENLTK
jgi:hypothetical protein